jgi:poly(3-hydroxybutyrate) depolymerase
VGGACVATAADDLESRRRSALAVVLLEQYLRTPGDSRKPLAEQSFAATALEKSDAEKAGALLWEEHVRRIRRERAAEMKERKIADGTLVMPFAYTVFGEKPARGRSLFISMHGGGGTAKAVNDKQWENQKKLYRPAEGVYLAPRAPTDHWNLWHEAHVDRMFARLIEDLIVFEEVDPDRVYLMGYSAGGDGVYQLAPRMADRFAAASMMAGHPNDASPLGLRNLPFAIHVGANDGGFKRNQVAAEWGKKLDALQQGDPVGYVHVVKLHAGKGHWMGREDAEAVPWMAEHLRDSNPRKVVWRQSTVTHGQFYWLANPEPKAGVEVTASVEGQQVVIEAKGVDRLTVRLSERLVDLSQPVTVVWNGAKRFEGVLPRTIGTVAKTLDERGDPNLTFTAELEITPDH